MKIEIKTAFKNGLIEQSIIERGELGPEHEFARRVVNLQEQGVREALIKLGWTPPREPADTPLSRAKAYIRREGWTINGNINVGFTVRQGSDFRRMTKRELLDFAGIDPSAEPR